MFYSLVGRIVWSTAKWYARRRLGRLGAPRARPSSSRVPPSGPAAAAPAGPCRQRCRARARRGADRHAQPHRLIAALAVTAGAPESISRAMAEPNPSAEPGRPAVPTVEFAEWLPALGGSRLLRVHGEAAGGSVPVLVLDTPSGEQRIEPRAQARFTRAHEWRASYLIASEVAAEGWSATTLVWPDG